MSIIPRKEVNPDDFTDDEVKFLRSGSVPVVIRAEMARRHDQNGIRVSAYRKAATAMRWEAAAIEAAIHLMQLKEEFVSAEQAMARLDREQKRSKALEATVTNREALLDQKDAEIQRLTAARALAEHAEGTGR